MTDQEAQDRAYRERLARRARAEALAVAVLAGNPIIAAEIRRDWQALADGLRDLEAGRLDGPALRDGIL